MAYDQPIAVKIDAGWGRSKPRRRLQHRHSLRAVKTVWVIWQPMKIARLAIAATLGLSAISAPAMAVPTITFERPIEPAPDKSADRSGHHDPANEAYDVLADYFRSASMEVKASITVGQRVDYDPFLDDKKVGQQRSNLGDFRLPPNVRQMFAQDEHSDDRPDVSNLLTLTDVPEPSAWCLMVVGLGLIGISLRMNRARWARTRFQ